MTKRKQKVKIGNCTSSSCDVEFGVPQGSVLGPVLFNIYIRSLSAVFNALRFKSLGYADDTNARKTFPLHFQFDIIHNKIPIVIISITNWMYMFLKINLDKTEIIYFIPKSLKHCNTVNGVIVPGIGCIRFSDVVKNLGVHLDIDLSMSTQISNVIGQCYRLLKNLGRIRNVLSQKQTEILVHALISSRLDYCNVLFYGINSRFIQSLQKVQNAAARLIFKKKKRDKISHLIEDLHWLRIEARIWFKIALFVFKCVNNLAPKSMIDKIVCYKDQDFILNDDSNFSSQYGRRSFVYIGPKIWNELPVEIRLISNIEVFKKKLKTLLFANFDSFKRKVFKYTI